MEQVKFSNLLFIGMLLFARQTHAYCDGGKYPNIAVPDEIKVSQFVVIGTVIARKIVVDPIEDPEGYEAEIFHVKVKQVLYGHPKQGALKPYLAIYNANTSARFLMDMGEKYLLFVSEGADGFFINHCGNSGEVTESKSTMAAIEKFKKRRNP